MAQKDTQRRQAEAVLVQKYQAAGMTKAEISRKTGLSRTQISYRLAMANNDLEAYTAGELRNQTEVLLNDVIRRAYERVESGELDDREAASYLKVISDTAMKKSRLLGIEAPTKLVHQLEQEWGSDDAR
ncbi:hypothetical protein [Streptomyces sp. NPDC127039]|uniref:hypothetical protein n=1 Tax=Streptomyces sp. NPDC127039 TaxID=3347115 RepID=UPI0036591822